MRYTTDFYDVTISDNAVIFNDKRSNKNSVIDREVFEAFLKSNVVVKLWKVEYKQSNK